jgi:hypothetical protein
MSKTNGTDLSKLTKAELVQVLTNLVNAPEAAADGPKSSKQQADELIEASPFTHTTGRVYLNGATIEAAARVHKTGTAEIVASAKGKRTAAVALWLQADDSVAAQNLRTA